MGGLLKATIFVCITLVSFHSSIALKCLTCTWYSPSTNKECYDATPSLSSACPYPADFPVYCQTSMILHDGLLTSITRGCQLATGDQDLSSDVMPADDECVTSYTGTSDVTTATCYFSTGTNNSNTQVSANLKLCDIDCGPNGQCDYISGKCACNTAFTGSNCTTGVAPDPESFMTCIQCDGDVTGASCETKTTGTNCPNPSHKFCSTTETTTYDPNGNEVRRVIVKGCATTYIATNQCAFSSRSDNLNVNDIEYTCISTCDTNNCNTWTPTGLTTVKQPLQCVICNSVDNANCKTETTRSYCPSSATYCDATVVYYLSENNDVRYQVDPYVSIISVTRGCATQPVTAQCTTTAVNDQPNLKKVTCQQTCLSDGCNVGWPARPLCSQCNSTLSTRCFQSPAPPSSCQQPYHEFCTIQDRNRNKYSDTSNTFGYRRTIVRGCSYNNIGNDCVDVNYGDVTLISCNKTCTTNSCNLGSVKDSATSLHHVSFTSLVALISAMMLVS